MIMGINVTKLGRFFISYSLLITPFRARIASVFFSQKTRW